VNILSGLWRFASRFIPATKHDVERLEKINMKTQQDLDDAIAALPGAIESALAPVIAAIQAKSAGTPVDLTAEIASLQAIPAAVSTAVTPAS
jgi:hypothetical protein